MSCNRNCAAMIECKYPRVCNCDICFNEICALREKELAALRAAAKRKKMLDNIGIGVYVAAIAAYFYLLIWCGQ